MTSALVEADFVVRQAFLSLVAKGVPVGQACKKIGIPRRTINNLVANDPDFADDYREAMDEVVERVDQVAYERAVDGEFKFVELFMKRYRPEMFALKAGGPNGSGAPQVSVAHLTVQIGQALVMGEHSEEWMAALHTPREVIEATSSEPDEPSS